jgi:hypothetical protein
MTTTTRPTLTALLTREVRRAVAQRDTALVDLELAPAARMGTEWARDRQLDVTSQNAFIARTAERPGMEPAELIAACVPAV